MTDLSGRLGTALLLTALAVLIAAATYLTAAIKITGAIEGAMAIARQERDQHWQAEIEKSNKAVLVQQAEAEAQLKSVEADASERIRRAEQQQLMMDQDNEKLADDRGHCGLDRAHIRLLPN